jgi:hypothetical protein
MHNDLLQPTDIFILCIPIHNLQMCWLLTNNLKLVGVLIERIES